MSIRCMTRIWEQSKHKGSQLLLLLAIADFADDNGFAFPGIETLAEKIRMTGRHTLRLVAALENSGELLVINRRARGNLYIVTIGLSKEQLEQAKSRACKFGADILELESDKLSHLSDMEVQESDNLSCKSDNLSCKSDIAMSPDPSLTVTEPSNNYNHDFSEDLEFPSTDNPLSISNMPSEPSGRRDKIPRKDYLEALSEFAEKQSTDRPKGWQDVRETVFEICQHVARLWFAGRLPTGTWGDRIEKWCAGAAELLRYHDDNLQTTRATLDRYHAHYVENEMTLSLAGPHSLINVISQFMAQNGAGSNTQKVLRIGR